jgi:hypothetical protein
MTKTQIAILWSLAVLVVIVFVFLGQFLSRSPQEEVIVVPTTVGRVYLLPEISQSARNLYPSADQAARSWQEDAQLVSASTSWPFVRLDDLSMPVDWTFQFFSPSTHKLYVVHTSESQVVPIREALSPYTLPTVSVGEWHVDSHQALGTWLDQGGGRFLDRYPVVDISARLRVTEGGRSEWSVVGIVKGSQTVHVVQVDAQSGSVVE